MEFNPINLLEDMIRKAQQIQGVSEQKPRQYMTPGMSSYTMSSGGSPELIPPPPSIAGTGQMQRDPEYTKQSSPLPPPSAAVKGGMTFGPQVNQGTAPQQGSPMIAKRPRATDSSLAASRKRRFGRDQTL
jgi:hypothetical protein